MWNGAAVIHAISAISLGCIYGYSSRSELISWAGDHLKKSLLSTFKAETPSPITEDDAWTFSARERIPFQCLNTQTFQTLLGKLFNEVSAGIESTVKHHRDDLQQRPRRMPRGVNRWITRKMIHGRPHAICHVIPMNIGGYAARNSHTAYIFECQRPAMDPQWSYKVRRCTLNFGPATIWSAWGDPLMFSKIY